VTAPPPPSTRLDVEARLDAWLHRQLEENPALIGIEQGEADEHLWIARLAGEAKERFAVRFVVGQRTLRAETYVIPVPARSRDQTYDFVLRANHDLYGVGFEIGPEEGIYLAGQLDLRAVDDDELDRLLGTLFSATERTFPRLVRLFTAL
jgi:hypothetical protein